MPEVVVNTSPLQYLFQTGLLGLFPALYGRIIVPEAVVSELDRGRELGCMLPAVGRLTWVTVRQPQHPVLLPLASGLGAGESEVLALAKETTESLAILDDRRARQYAHLLGIRYTGTLGVLLKAKQTGKLVALKPVLEQLASLGFRFRSETYDAILRLADELP